MRPLASTPKLAHEVALQIAAGAPRYVSEDHIPAELLEHERQIARKRAEAEGKSANVVERIVEGQLEKFKDEVCLMRQPYIRDEKTTVEQLVLQNVAATGENLVIRRFQRWEVGENLDE